MVAAITAAVAFAAMLGISMAQVSLPNTATQAASVAAAQATAPTLSKTSSVKGKAFDRFVVIYLENTDYDKAAGDRKLPYQRNICAMKC